jgi:hypothetical protein
MAGSSAVENANRQLVWYRSNARRARIGYYTLELVALGVSFAVAAIGIFSWDATLAAMAGAVLVLIAGVRAIFQWREGWVASVMAQTELETAIDFYEQGMSPFDGNDRDQQLTRRVWEIRNRETAAWQSRRQAPPAVAPEGYEGAKG